ncbi:DoxX-like protein [Micromonospora kangleipakensis]|uniref:DoxX-like protein n=1 Tax=Micromonospora kangleipakensis TaxID=1077942 RepID=A0A4Q8B676_9ACTN|nr:DoxX family protein [Micromonospora kangleipakensis]RZU72551.1 DoxX-like protein [Micromonospora kangleipakensis]
MHIAYVVVTALAVAATGFSGIAALLHFRPILPGMAAAGVAESWLTFPIGTLKTAGAVGLLLGLLGVPLVGVAAAAGLVLFFACAVHTHLLAHDRSAQFLLANGLLVLSGAALALGLTGS